MTDKDICKLFAIRKSPKRNKDSSNENQDIEVGVGNKHGPFWICNFPNEAHGDILWNRKRVQIWN